MAYPITFLKYEVQTAGLNSAFLPAEAIFFKGGNDLETEQFY